MNKYQFSLSFAFTSIVIFFLTCLSSATIELTLPEKRICIVILSYNNLHFYEKNLETLLSQKYENFYAIYIDDCSTDGTGEAVERYLEKHPRGHKVKLVKNKLRLRQLANMYETVSKLPDNVIVACYDGDDWFYTDTALSRVNREYQNDNVWLTWGSFIDTQGKVRMCRAFPEEVIRNRTFRSYTWVTSHLRTFYAGLFKKIRLEDLFYDGKFLAVAGDTAFIYPMLEMAGHRIRYIPDILYVYNMNNPLCIFQKFPGLQAQMAAFIKAKQKYPLLDQLF